MNLIGGKGSGLDLINRIGISCPEYTVLDGSLFLAHIQDANLAQFVDEYWRLLPTDNEHIILRLRKAIINGLLNHDFSPKITEAIDNAYNSIKSSDTLVLRSSAKGEDGGNFSWAGQFITQFGINSLEQLEKAVKLGWASCFSSSVAEYMVTQEKVTPIVMGLILQRALHPYSSGVAFSEDPSGQFQNTTVIEATLGLGIPLVNGLTTPERWVCSKKDLKKISASKKNLIFIIDQGFTPGQTVNLSTPKDTVNLRTIEPTNEVGTYSATVLESTHDSEKAILDRNLVSQINQTLQNIIKKTGIPTEIEWAVDSNRKIWILQQRPITSFYVENSSSNHLSNSTTNETDIMLRGATGAQGKANGEGVLEENIPEDGREYLLFKNNTAPEDIKDIKLSKGVITREGGILSHSAIVCRELKKPCIINASPFPTAKEDVNQNLIIDANQGTVSTLKVAASSHPKKSKVRESRVFPRLDLHSEPIAGEKATYSNIHYHMPDEWQNNIPKKVADQLKHVCNTAGVLKPLNVFPDLRSAHEDLGFPIGTYFHSHRFHPTAVSDCGDAFRIIELEGVHKDDVTNMVGAISQEIIHRLRPKANKDISKKFIENIFANGVNALDKTEWKEADKNKIENNGYLVGANTDCFNKKHYELARKCLTWHGALGHFIEFLHDSSGKVFLLMHTGAIELGLYNLQTQVQKGLPKALQEGVDDPDNIHKGYWGLDVSDSDTREMLGANIALINYSFARRSIISSIIELSLKKHLPVVNFNLISDIVHTGVRVTNKGILYQQGTQLLSNLPLVLAGAPNVVSYLIYPKPDQNQVFIHHGKINYGTPPFRPRDLANKINEKSLLISSESFHNHTQSDCQVRWSASLIEFAAHMIELRPFWVLRGQSPKGSKLKINPI